MKAWEGRFNKKTDSNVEGFTESISIDRRLYSEDITGSKAHADMLCKAGLISEDDNKKIQHGLDAVKKEIDEGRFVFDPADEDIHIAIESALIKKVGDAGKKLHTGRSRNDQVALDERLFLRDLLDKQGKEITGLMNSLVDIAKKYETVIIPGMTHLQPAQPVLLSHFFLAYFEKFRRDHQQFLWLKENINEMPLGAGALAGSSLPLEPEYVMKKLGFDRLSRNSMDAVSDRDPILRYLPSASICSLHLSSLSEEFILWNSPFYGFVELPDEYATGSSMMPQKKNPDIFELTRGRTGKVIGSMLNLMITMKGLPLTYNRDLQEDKEALFSASDTLSGCISIMSQSLENISFNTDRIEESLKKGFITATDCAEALAGGGIPFREAHSIVGKWVARAVADNRGLSDYTPKDLEDISPAITDDIIERADVSTSIDNKKTPGSPGRDFVNKALREAGVYLSKYLS